MLQARPFWRAQITRNALTGSIHLPNLIMVEFILDKPYHPNFFGEQVQFQTVCLSCYFVSISTQSYLRLHVYWCALEARLCSFLFIISSNPLQKQRVRVDFSSLSRATEGYLTGSVVEPGFEPQEPDERTVLSIALLHSLLLFLMFLCTLTCFWFRDMTVMHNIKLAMPSEDWQALPRFLKDGGVTFFFLRFNKPLILQL